MCGSLLVKLEMLALDHGNGIGELKNEREYDRHELDQSVQTREH